MWGLVTVVAIWFIRKYLPGAESEGVGDADEQAYRGYDDSNYCDSWAGGKMYNKIR